MKGERRVDIVVFVEGRLAVIAAAGEELIFASAIIFAIGLITFGVIISNRREGRDEPGPTSFRGPPAVLLPASERERCGVPVCHASGSGALPTRSIRSARSG